MQPERGEVRLRICLTDLSVGVLLGSLVAAAGSSACSANTPPSAGFWYEDGAFTLPADLASRLGGPLAPGEIETIKRVSLDELRQAFARLRVTVTAAPPALWKVRVVDVVPQQGGLPTAGQSMSLGVMGGNGWVGFQTLTLSAVNHAPAGTVRRQVIEGIGRGIGRAAAHEFAHQILGRAMPDDKADSGSYDYFTSDRPSQFYGELHWAGAWPLLQQKLTEKK